MSTKSNTPRNSGECVAEKPVAHETSYRSPSQASGPEEPPQDGGYAWVYVLYVFLIYAHTWGFNGALGVFLAYYLSHNIFPGTTPLDYAFIMGLSLATALIVSPVVTITVHKFSLRLALNIGVALQTASFIATSFASKSWHLLLGQGICFGAGMGFLFIGCAGVVSQWFDKKRSFANGITAAGTGVGGLIYSLATGAMIPRFGYPWTLRALGIICFVVNLPCANLIRARFRPNQPTLSSLLGFAFLRQPEYVALLLWTFFSGMAYVAILFSLSSYMVAVGFTQKQGSIGTALLNLGQAFGRPAVGFLSDRYGRSQGAFVATFLAGLFCFVIWIFAESSLGLVYFFSIIEGLVAGTAWAVAPPLTAEAVGLSGLPGGLGLLWMAIIPPATVSEAIALELRDLDGKRPYLWVKLFVGFCYIVAAVCLIPFHVFLSRRKRAEKVSS